ncbi:aerobic glycerol-3-phosphate dehydrogenase [Salmonella sp. NCTC 11881]|nr:aerobic glycerol-3-phosphate dehydrogenase [Salmonella sp. NCTC 11881]
MPRVHNQKQAYILQNEDKRIVFVIPWMEEFSIIGTTDVEYKGDPKAVKIEESEINYLLKVYNAHFQKQLGRDDIVWTYSGVRPLCDDESDSPQAITRDYTLDIHDENGKAPLLSVFGGKLTTYRKLAEHAMEKTGVLLSRHRAGMDQNVRTARRRHRRQPRRLRGEAASSLSVPDGIAGAPLFAHLRQQTRSGFSAKPRRCLI